MQSGKCHNVVRLLSNQEKDEWNQEGKECDEEGRQERLNQFVLPSMSIQVRFLIQSVNKGVAHHRDTYKGGQEQTNVLD